MALDKNFQDKQPSVHKRPQYDRAEGGRHKNTEIPDELTLMALQDQVGNHVVQGLLAQRQGNGPFELDDETASRINQARGGGQSLDSGMQETMSAATGYDFSQVKVHTSPEASTLSEQLGAKAFTTGQDVFFRERAYDPHSSGGQELLAHELTHVVQQATGAVSTTGSGMTVNAPNDVYEQEANALAQDITRSGTEIQPAGEGGVVARQEIEDDFDENLIARQTDSKDDLLPPEAMEEPPGSRVGPHRGNRP